MFNTKFIGDESAGREPLSILASMAVECVRDYGVAANDAASRDVTADEHRVMWTAYRALCESRGLRAVGSYELTWALYCLGVLESAVGWFCMGDDVAAYAWPEHRVALMLSIPLSSFAEEDSAEEILEMAYHEEARDAAFQQVGWTVVRIDPRSRRLDEQLARVADFVAAQSPDTAS